MTITITCSNCSSGIHIIPKAGINTAKCPICNEEMNIALEKEHEQGILKRCVLCKRKDFYSQKDFNRKIGVLLFVIAAILSIFTYGISFIVLYIFDVILFKKLGSIGVCYKCNTIYRNINNIDLLRGFDHEMNDRIIYSDHDFEGRPLPEH